MIIVMFKMAHFFSLCNTNILFRDLMHKCLSTESYWWNLCLKIHIQNLYPLYCSFHLSVYKTGLTFIYTEFISTLTAQLPGKSKEEAACW